MTEFVLIAFVVLSLAVNGVLTFAFLKLLRAYLQMAIVSSPLPVHEKALLMDKTAEEVAVELPRRPRREDIVPMFGGGRS